VGPPELPSKSHRQSNDSNCLTPSDRVLDSFSFSDPKLLSLSPEPAKLSVGPLTPLPATIFSAQLDVAVPDTPVIHRRSSLPLRSVRMGRMGRKAVSPYNKSYNHPVAPNAKVPNHSFEAQITGEVPSLR
jgi:hypothetical protein